MFKHTILGEGRRVDGSGDTRQLEYAVASWRAYTYGFGAYNSLATHVTAENTERERC